MFLRYFRFLDSLVDFSRHLLGILQLIDQTLVLQELVDVALGAGQYLQDGVFDLDECLLVLAVLDDDV